MSHRIIKFSEFNEYGTVKKENDYATERNTVIISLSNKQAQQSSSTSRTMMYSCDFGGGEFVMCTLVIRL